MSHGSWSECGVRSLIVAIGVGVCLNVLIAGCSSGGEADLKRYSPSSTTARESLDKVLAAWKQGEPPEKKLSSSPAIELVDSKREPGQTLASYEILDEETTQDVPKRFSVRLKLENPTAELETRYVVLGRDPIWVFREEDYVRAQGM